MPFAVIPFPAEVVALWALTAYLVHRLLKLKPEPPPRIRLNFHYPAPQRANLMVIFDGKRDLGPFFTRATLLHGAGLRLTRDSVDGLPDGDDPAHLLAPMSPVPLGDGVHRTIGPVGIDADGLAQGRIKIEVVDQAGALIAATKSRF